MLELMGTQRARRFPREVQDPGGLKKGFLYMWDGESSPLQLTPFLHLDQGSEEERVYVLAGLAGDPVYQARGQSDARRHPDQLLTQLAERAPFLLESTPAVTTARPPDAAKWYRAAVEVALADGMVSAAEEARLTALRLEIGMPEGEALVIHSELGWHAQEVSPAPSAPRDTPSRKPTQDAWQAAAHRLLSRVRDRLPGQLSFDPKAVLLDDEIDSGDGELWIELGRSQGVSVWFPSKRGAHLRLAVGFYSTHGSRDPAYRAARGQLESGSLPSRSGWSPWSHQSKASDLALESHTRVSIARLDAEALTEKLLGAVVALANAAAAALAGPVDAPAPSPPEVRGDAEPVSSPVPADFPLDPLVGSPRIRGSVWVTRILWALEWARRHDPAPKSAASIAKILSAHGVSVPGTNTARAFRDAKDDPRVGGLVEQVEGQCYVITARGRRALFERSD